MQNAVHTSDLDATHLAYNPIKRVFEHGNSFDGSPYTCSSTGAGTANKWTVDLIEKVGQNNSSWYVNQIHILNTSGNYSYLQSADVYAYRTGYSYNYRCGILPATIYNGGLWHTILCSSNLLADHIEIRGRQSQPLQICGVKVYGYHSQTITNETGSSFAIDTDMDGIPYVINYAGYSYYYPSSTWEKKWTNPQIIDFAISPTNEFWKLDRNNLKPYKYDGANWILKDDLACSRISAGPNYAWSIDLSNNIKKYDGSTWTAVADV